MLHKRLRLPPTLRRSVHVLGVTQIIGWGTTFYVPAVLAPALMSDMGWSRTALFGAFSMSLLLGGLLAPYAGRAIDRVGGRAVMTAGSAVAALGLCVMALASDLPTYFAAWAILGLAMRLALYEAAFATLATAAGQEARRSISVLTLYGGLASTVFWPIGWFLIENLGWRATCFTFAVLNLVVCLPLHARALPTRHAVTKREELPSATVTAAPLLQNGRDRRLALIGLTIAFALMKFVDAAISMHLIDTLIAFGLDPDTAVSISALRGIGQVAGRLWETVFAGALGPMTLCLVAIGLAPLAFMVLFFVASQVSGALFSFVQGASNGLVTIAGAVAPLLLFGPKGYGALTGAMAMPALLASASAPALHALMVDRFGHRAALAIELAAVLIATILVAALAVWLRRQSSFPPRVPQGGCQTEGQ